MQEFNGVELQSIFVLKDCFDTCAVSLSRAINLASKTLAHNPYLLVGFGTFFVVSDGIELFRAAVAVVNCQHETWQQFCYSPFTWQLLSAALRCLIAITAYSILLFQPVWSVLTPALWIAHYSITLASEGYKQWALWQRQQAIVDELQTLNDHGIEYVGKRYRQLQREHAQLQREQNRQWITTAAAAAKLTLLIPFLFVASAEMTCGLALIAISIAGLIRSLCENCCAPSDNASKNDLAAEEIELPTLSERRITTVIWQAKKETPPAYINTEKNNASDSVTPTFYATAGKFGPHGVGC